MTTDSHFNPCFWSALWNESYLESIIRGDERRRIPRDEVVFCYNLRSRKILKTKVSTIHKHKGLGFAEFTYESAKKYARSLKPSGQIVPAVKKWSSKDPAFLDAEAFFCGLESMPTYVAVLNVVKCGRINSPTEKTNLASFFVIHNERLAAAWSAQPSRDASRKDHNLEHIVLLKRRLSDSEYLFSQVLPLALGGWYVHEYTESVLLLGDTGFPFIGSHFMAAISV